MATAELLIENSHDQALTVSFAGSWKTGKIPAFHSLLKQLSQQSCLRVSLRADGISDWDSRLPSRLLQLERFCSERNIELDISALPSSLRNLIELATAVPVNETSPPVHASRMDAIRHVWREFIDTFAFVGEMVLACKRLVTGRSHMRWTDLLSCLNQAGPQALAIITLISILVGMILAYLGMVQLRQFGAEVYVANLVAVGMVREMGALMTAVIMAGRTGAAWAAELGAMQVNEEVDALNTMGIRPMDFLVMPRLLAMTIVMPLLCIYSFVLGMAGGAFIVLGMDMTPQMYLHQLLSSFTAVDVAVGCFKGLVFGHLIVLSGCQAGMNCGGSSAAVGSATTRAVVQAIVYFVVADAGFNILFYKLGI